jgi:hypothetical protein
VWADGEIIRHKLKERNPESDDLRGIPDKPSGCGE